MSGSRIEHDAMGDVILPEEAYWGAETQRAVENFRISGWRLPPEFIRAIAIIKRSAAVVAREMNILHDETISDAIIAAADEVIEGLHPGQFPLDVFQTGSGTSTNMNLNEVLANRAAEIKGGARGQKHVHPNDDVNICQSSNDVIPTAMNVSAAVQIRATLIPSLEKLHASLAAKASKFDRIPKIGRTHLQDATPVTLGQEFSGYARQVELAIERIRATEPRLHELALGGTAVGTGINTAPGFPARTIAEISRYTGISFREAKNHFEAQAARDVIVELSGQLRVVAVSLRKIADDIRWMSSGPESGLFELLLPALQPGSSIMPGKVNPVIPEMVMQVSAQVIGHDAAIAAAGSIANFELCTAMPMMAANLLDEIMLLANAAESFASRCVDGIKANEEKMRSLADASSALSTSLVPVLGHDEAVRIAKIAKAEHTTVKAIVLRENLLSPERAAELLEPLNLTKPFRAQ